MYTAREALTAHLAASDLPFGTVAPWAGEALDSLRAAVPLPACYIVFAEADLTDRRRYVTADLLLVVRTTALEAQEGAADGLALVEDTATWLLANHFWTYEGHTYQLLLHEGIQPRARLIRPDHSVYQIRLRLEQWST